MPKEGGKPVRITQNDGTKRIIGYVDRDTFYTNRKVKEHLYRGGLKDIDEARKQGLSAWGIDAKALEGMIKMGVLKCVIEADDGTYTCYMEDFKKLGAVLEYKPHRPQYMLNELNFKKVAKNGKDSAKKVHRGRKRGQETEDKQEAGEEGSKA